MKQRLLAALLLAGVLLAACAKTEPEDVSAGPASDGTEESVGSDETALPDETTLPVTETEAPPAVPRVRIHEEDADAWLFNTYGAATGEDKTDIYRGSRRIATVDGQYKKHRAALCGDLAIWYGYENSSSSTRRAYLIRDGAEPVLLEKASKNMNAFRVSVNGGAAAFTNSAALYRISRDGTEKMISMKVEAGEFRLSPDGSYIAYRADGVLKLWHESFPAEKSCGVNAIPFGVSDDGKIYAVGADDRTVYYGGPGDMKKIYESDWNSILRIALNRDCTECIFTGSGFSRISVKGGEPSKFVEWEKFPYKLSDHVYDVDTFREGAYLAPGRNDNFVDLYYLAGDGKTYRLAESNPSYKITPYGNLYYMRTEDYYEFRCFDIALRKYIELDREFYSFSCAQDGTFMEKNGEIWYSAYAVNEGEEDAAPVRIFDGTLLGAVGKYALVQKDDKILAVDGSGAADALALPEPFSFARAQKIGATMFLVGNYNAQNYTADLYAVDAELNISALGITEQRYS